MIYSDKMVPRLIAPGGVVIHQGSQHNDNEAIERAGALTALRLRLKRQKVRLHTLARIADGEFRAYAYNRNYSTTFRVLCRHGRWHTHEQRL